MTDPVDVVARLTAWIRDYGDQKQPAFVNDLSIVLAIARDALSKDGDSATVDVAYGIFPKRSDSGTPKLVKMLGDCVYHNTEDADEAVQLLQRFSDVPLQVRELNVTVGNVVKREPDDSALAEGGDVA